MFDRLSVNALLKAVIAILSAAVMVMLALGAWNSWTKLNAVKQIAAVSNASGYMFTVLHNMRVDRASTYRDLMAEKQFTAVSPLIQTARGSEMPALKSALVALEAVDFPERQAAISGLSNILTKLTALQDESNTAFTQPKAARRRTSRRIISTWPTPWWTRSTN